MNFKTISRDIISIVVAITVLWSCSEETIHQRTDGYFPVETGQERTYQRWLISEEIETTSWILDTLTFRVTGDTTIQGQRYKTIASKEGFVEKVVRSEGSRYYGRNHELYSGYSEEYMFLDIDKPEGSSWEYVKREGTKTEYVIKGKNMRHNISGKIFDDVIEVEVNYYVQEQPGVYRYWLTSLHYYARGAGEIYSYYPSPVSGYYANVESFLMTDNK